MSKEELDRDRLIEIIADYLAVGRECYTYNLTRVRRAFQVGTISLEDFEEWEEDNVVELVDYIIENYDKP